MNNSMIIPESIHVIFYGYAVHGICTLYTYLEFTNVTQNI